MTDSLHLELRIIRQPDGSSLFTQRDTTVMVGVYGPAEVRMAREMADRATVEVSYKPKIKQGGCEERFREKMIMSAFDGVILSEVHPRTGINIVLQEIQDSGSLLSCSINAVCCSLLDACVPMRSTVAAVTCAVGSDRQIIVSPVKAEEEKAVALVTVAFESTDGSIVALSSSGAITESQLQDCIAACRHTSGTIFELYKDKMKEIHLRNSGPARS